MASPQAFEGVHDQPVAVPVWHAGQVQPFTGAGQADVLLVDAGLLAKAQWYLAVVEHLQLVGTGAARQLVGDCYRQFRVHPLYGLGARRR